MGTKVHCESYLPGYYSMRDLNEDSSSSSWPLFYENNGITNGQYYNGFVPRNIIDGYPGYDKDTLKQKMLEHEAVFKNQVYELHRLYRIQRDMMEEVEKTRASMDPSSSSSLQQGSQVPSEDPRRWHMAGFPLVNSGYPGQSNSPASCTKGNSTQTGRSPFQNGYKDYEALDSRPLKVRKKLFDLQLPADEYIDTEEGEKVNGGRDGLTDCRIDASASGSCSRNPIRLADLNEPIQIEEAQAPQSVDFLSSNPINGGIKGINQSAKSNTGHLSVAGETMYARDKFLMDSPVESKVNERERLFHIYEAGSSASQGHRQEKLPALPHPGQGVIYPLHHPSRIYPTGYSREAWRDGSQRGLELDRNLDRSSNSHLEPTEVSQSPGSFPFFNSTSFASTHAHTVSSWKPSSFSQKINMFDSSPSSSAAAVDRSLNFGGKWMVNSSSRLNPGSASEMIITANGFYDGSASGSRDPHFHLPSAGFDNRNCIRGNNVPSDRMSNHGLAKFPTASSSDPKPALNINLNEVLSKAPLDLNMIDRKNKTEDRPLVFPWLNPKRSCDTSEAVAPGKSDLFGILQDSSKRLSYRSDAVRDLNKESTPEETPVSSDCEIMRNKEIVETQNVKKILGFPIFELKKEQSSLVSTSASVECPRQGSNVNNERRRMIDINLECEPDEQMDSDVPTVEKEKQTNSTRFEAQIDLNSPFSNSEDPPAPSRENKCASVMLPFDINLEAPVLPESEDETDTPLLEENNPEEMVPLQSVETKNEQPQDDVLRKAAEAMFFMSSACPEVSIEDEMCNPSEVPTMESFASFVESITSCANEIVSTSGECLLTKDGNVPELDDFELMTLQLAETKEDDYMPVPFVPEFTKIEDPGTSAVITRPRRGQSRRGRQRRDFQRDILPGIVSLSRHEVTEDIQIFGGMMKATGHSWSGGLTRRNGTRSGAGRGRKRAVVETVPAPVPEPVCTPPLVQQLSNIEAGLEDRSLTGWGKTTRRPRRQRCPAGNPPTSTVVLT